MNPQIQLDDSSTLNAEIAEERELQRILNQTKLKEAVARPVSFWGGWSFSIFLGVPVVLYLQGRYQEIWVVIFLLILKLMHSIHSGVHARIDALVELERLRDVSSLQAKDNPAEQDASGNRR